MIRGINEEVLQRRTKSSNDPIGFLEIPRAGVRSITIEVLVGHTSNSVHGQVYVCREGLPLSLLREGLEKLRYEEVVKALASR